jgi:hypothetical protein
MQMHSALEWLSVESEAPRIYSDHSLAIWYVIIVDTNGFVDSCDGLITDVFITSRRTRLLVVRLRLIAVSATHRYHHVGGHPVDIHASSCSITSLAFVHCLSTATPTFHIFDHNARPAYNTDSNGRVRFHWQFNVIHKCQTNSHPCRLMGPTGIVRDW